jgi:hypothetical protein
MKELKTMFGKENDEGDIVISKDIKDRPDIKGAIVECFAILFYLAFSMLCFYGSPEFQSHIQNDEFDRTHYSMWVCQFFTTMLPYWVFNTNAVTWTNFLLWTMDVVEVITKPFMYLILLIPYPIGIASSFFNGTPVILLANLGRKINRIL